MIFKKFWKRTVIGSSIFTSVLATGLSTSLLSHKNETNNTKFGNTVNYHQEINQNTEKVKDTIKKTSRSDLFKILNNFSNYESEKPSLKLATSVVRTKDDNLNEQYAIGNLSATEKNKIIDLIYQIGSGIILISDLVKKAEKTTHNDLDKLISKIITDVNSNENQQNLEIGKQKKYLLNSKNYNDSTNYSNEDLEGFAAFIDPNYLKHLKDRSTYLMSYATILSVATAAAWGVAAYYWTCWWMFGANVPFAVAATVQAGLMTADMGIAWADYAFNELVIKDVLNLRQKPIYDLVKYSIKGDITYHKIRNLLSRFGVSKINKDLIKNIIFKLKNIIKRIKSNFWRTIVSKNVIKSGISGTSWVSPVGLTVISVISLILNVSNLIINFAWH